MQTTLASLLLITSAVVLTCIVVNYAVAIVEQTLDTTNLPELYRIRNLESAILNYTDTLYENPSMFNQTSTPPPVLP